MAAKVGIPWLRISIHALREEGDMLGMATQRSITISIHALREEGDVKYLSDKAYGRFLSTPSARRATSGSKISCRT